MSLLSRACTLTLFLLLALGTGCHTTDNPSIPTGSMFLSLDTSERGTPLPRTDFHRGEVPQVVITGYGGKVVTLEVRTREGVLVGSRNFTVPEQQTTREEKGIVYKNTYGSYGMMQPYRQVEFRTTPAGLLVRLKPPPPGNYEVRLIVDGAVRQAVPLRVGGF